MDDLIKELVEDFKKERKKIARENKKINKSSKIVAKVNEEGCVEVLEIRGSRDAILSTICIILQNMEEYGGDSATNMATIILTALEMEKKIHEWKSNIRFI